MFFFFLIPFIVVLAFVLETVADVLNVKSMSSDIPDEFTGEYDREEYARAQKYNRDKVKLGITSSGLFVVLFLLLYFSGGFNILDLWIRRFGYDEILTGVFFAGALFLAGEIISLPFSIYNTFVLEERYGFNRTTPKTFLIDRVKGIMLAAVIGAPLFAGVLYFFITAGDLAWFYCWVGLTIVQLIMTFLAPIILLPLFNKYEPLEVGELRDAIEKYAGEHDFKMEGIYRMDASKRSTKSNAFFTGFGRYRRIVLFDTLIEKQTVNELVAILAHEMGHYKKGHIHEMIGLSIVTSGIMFYLLSFFIDSPPLFGAFQMENISVYAGLIFFGILYTPIELLISLGVKYLSRRNEYEADRFAAQTHGNPENLVSALKKLSVENLANLTPHPLKVFLDYSHPPVLERIKELRKQT